LFASKQHSRLSPEVDPNKGANIDIIFYCQKVSGLKFQVFLKVYPEVNASLSET